MNQRQAILIVVAIFQVLLASRILVNVHTELEQLESRWHARRTAKKRKQDDNDLALLGALLYTQKTTVRRFWIDAQSNHWITHVLDGMLLQEAQLDKAFRMSRNLFDMLHSVLGLFQPTFIKVKE